MRVLKEKRLSILGVVTALAVACVLPVSSVRAEEEDATVTAAALVTAVQADGLWWETEEGELARAAMIVGPEKNENNCQSCHALEHEAWIRTRHYATFKDRHQSDEAKEISKNMGMRSMKREFGCRQCHYTSEEGRRGPDPNWGVSCESCHGPAKEWVDFHNKIGGDPSAKVIKWGEAKDVESREQRTARFEAGEKHGMIHSEMLYDIAVNCFSCHTVPSEELVNKGKHKAGSDFDLVKWSQGEVRHNYVSSAGAPDKPTNRPATQEQLRRMYIIGAWVDFETTLRNLTKVKEKDGDFHKAMLARATRLHEQLTKIFAAVELPVLADVFKTLPSSFDASTTVDAAAVDKMSDAGRKFVQEHDGSKLGGVDSMIPTDRVGEPHKE